jgi:hypothetical protein
MIQRIQSVLLFDIVILSVLTLFFPFVQYQSGDTVLAMSLMPQSIAPGISQLVYIPSALNIIVPLFSLYVISQYKDRPKQAKLARVLLLLILALLTAMLAINFHEGEQTGWTKTYLWPSFLPIASAISAFLAARFIKKDEELVRSADRIR